MSDIKTNIHSIDQLEEKRMLDAYLKSGQHQLSEAMATTPDLEAPQSAFDSYMHGAEVSALPVNSSTAKEVGDLAAEHIAEVIPIKK